MAIEITEAAAGEVKTILEKEGKPGAALRVFVQGGGCSGLSYGMSIEEDITDADEKLECFGVNIVVDPMSVQYLDGARVDYVTTMMGGGFKIENPNATSSCGCGHSFQA